ncbi:putative toxin-antitoxin system toxin component, PIN family [Thiothrix eikelboomii]|uniref:Putative toxin-antitoxin system toxin component, PIN family n=1 Tax=Thiothrix eikelboomii TaxID=92487 RepID=A0A1T4W2B5_9GAMM|nr:putative toxin-antitoxin system toxin component, PIN family [Thiothrix eikelboomii]SKA71392.1 putative toxin-antitoxin system toxin component, PIN family [Thiothrix eikelboomii]
MTEQPLRVVVDTNVLLSFLMKHTSKPGVLVTYILQQHQALLSTNTLRELVDKCSRAKFRPYFSEAEAQKLVQLLSQVGETVTVNITITDCRDAKDNQFLELAIAGNADLLVSGDKDLLDLHPYQGIPILTPHDSLLFLGVEYGKA